MRSFGRHAAFWLGIAGSLWVAGCGGGSGGGNTTPPVKTTPTVTVTPASTSISTAQSLSVTISISGNPAPTGTVTLSSGSYSSSATSLSNGSATISIAAGTLPAGTDTLSASYSGDSSYNNASGSARVTVSAPTKTTPTVTVTPSSTNITTVQSVTVTVVVRGTPTATGTVTLSGGGYTSSAVSLTSGSASFTIAVGALATGTDTLSASYSGDANYNAASGSSSITVSKVTPTVTVTPAASNITVVQSLTVTVALSGTPAPSGTVTLTSGTYSSGAITLNNNGSASVTIAAGKLALGADTLSASYSGDANYNTASGSNSVTVSKVNPTVTVSPSSPSITTVQALMVTVTLSSAGNPTPSGSVTLSGGGYTSSPITLVTGAASFNIPAGALAVGTDTLTASYTPDGNSSSTYNSTSGTGSVTVTSTTPFTLTVNSSVPTSGISISVSPKDNNNTTTGNTPFTLTYNPGTQVTLTAAQLVNGYSFVSWTGCTSTVSTTCDVTLNANTTVTIAYNAPTQVTSITLACTAVSTSASCSSSPTAGTVVIGTQAQFSATVNGTGSFSKGVTWSLAAPSGSTQSPGTLSSTGLYNTPYPAPATVAITATSTQNTAISSTMTVTLSAATATGPALAVDMATPSTPSQNPHTINPYIYGVNAFFLDTTSENIANPGLLRWGGDDTSRYNYQNGYTNSASDYYFESFQGAADMFPNGSGSTSFNQFVQSTDAAGSAALGTVPVLGWVTNGTNLACSFTKTQFPNQQQFNGNNCGNGVLTSGTDLNGNSGTSSTQIQNLTSVSEPEPDITAGTTPAPGSVTSAWANGTWAGGWVNSLVTNPSYGTAASGKGVAMWDLDNEPTWWDAVHRDVHPAPFSYDEVTNNGVGTALAIKTADPTALVSGPVIDYWWAYFYSKKDIENGWASGSPCYQPWSNPTDRTAHGGVPMIEYYLQQFAKYSQSYGVRLLDYVDIHGYFSPNYNGSSVGFTTAGDTQEQIARMNGTRVFWDKTYTDPNYAQPNYTTDANYTTSCAPPAQAPQLIPMLQNWVKNDYPGTKTAIDEYNFGGLESINGAVVQADILGIFGRQGLDMGAFWPTQAYNTQQPGNYAFAMYRNYDGNKSGFGDTYLYATSTGTSGDAEGQLAVYAAQRSSDHAVTIMVVNKTYGPLTSTLSVNNSTITGASAQVYQYSNTNLNAIVSGTPAVITAPSSGGTTSTITYTFPAQSITLLVIPN
jgi:hypothetical protein